MVKDVIKFFEDVGKLKKLKRTGWVREGIPNAESVAEHTLRVAIMSMVLAKKTMNMEKLLKMALIHDLPEAKAGDLVAERKGKVDLKKKEEKQKLEIDAMKEICKNVETGDELFKLWSDYEEGESEEAKLVKQMDKLEMALQAHEYEEEHGKNLGEFFVSTSTYLKDSDLIKLFEHIKSKRK